MSFAIGEIAELVYSRYGHVGAECEITGGLEYRLNRRTFARELSYAIEVDGQKYLALPDQLRKKRPPQDWVKLCNLRDVPRELETA